MPRGQGIKQFCCRICAKQGKRRCAPRSALREGHLSDRMKWLRHHRAKYHPEAFRASVKKSVGTRSGQ